MSFQAHSEGHSDENEGFLLERVGGLLDIQIIFDSSHENSQEEEKCGNAYSRSNLHGPEKVPEERFSSRKKGSHHHRGRGQ